MEPVIPTPFARWSLLFPGISTDGVCLKVYIRQMGFIVSTEFARWSQLFPGLSPDEVYRL